MANSNNFGMFGEQIWLSAQFNMLCCLYSFSIHLEFTLLPPRIYGTTYGNYPAITPSIRGYIVPT
jgi:hypothetical protein